MAKRKQRVQATVPAYTMRIGPKAGAQPGELAADVRLGRNIAANPELLGSSKGKPCPTARKGCPMQLVYKDGKAYFRLCATQKRPGQLIEAGPPAEAYKRAKAICGCWARSGKRFDRCVPSNAPIGGSRRSKRR